MTSDWVTETFQFCRGIFTGDNYSPIIFNVVFQPLTDFLNTRKESQGYKLGEARIITKPFADDFELISNNKIQHQKLQTQIQKNASTMGLTFKPGKCRSLSISGGKPDPTVKFFLNDPVTNQPTQLKTLKSDSHKFFEGCHDTPELSPGPPEVPVGQAHHEAQQSSKCQLPIFYVLGVKVF